MVIGPRDRVCIGVRAPRMRTPAAAANSAASLPRSADWWQLSSTTSTRRLCDVRICSLRYIATSRVPVGASAKSGGELESAAAIPLRYPPAFARPSARRAARKSPVPNPFRRTAGSCCCPLVRMRQRSRPAGLWEFRFPCRGLQERQRHRSCFGRTDSTSSTTSPSVVNLMALPTRFTMTCRRPMMIADQAFRDVRREVTGQFETLAVGAEGQ